MAFGTISVTSPRLLLDISTLLRHWERADGITRTLSKFAAYALDNVPEIAFVYLGDETPLLVNAYHVRLLIDGKVRIDTSHFRDPGAKARLRDRLPSAFKSTILWIQRPRRQALLSLERVAFHFPRLASIANRFRPRLLNEKYRRALNAPDGSVMNLVPHDLAFNAMEAPTTEDVLILAGSDWLLMSNTVQLNPKPKTVAFCYDVIPLFFPGFFSEKNVSAFRDCIESAFARADLVFFSANQIARDTAGYWKSRGIPVPPTATITLGADIPDSAGLAGSLPAPLMPQKFALFVSTIEPRKNHRVLFEAWKTLLDESIPQTFDFRLVFVGRKGWMVDDLWQEMTTHPDFGKSLIILSHVDDAALIRLYDKCAFTLYPSHYEGFGLPIIESFRHGKAVIASSAGALPETVAGFSPCLSPSDEAAWRDMLKQWIVDPSAYGDYERHIRLHYAAQNWDTTAAEFFQVIRERLIPAAQPSPALDESK